VTLSPDLGPCLTLGNDLSGFPSLCWTLQLISSCWFLWASCIASIWLAGSYHLFPHPPLLHNSVQIPDPLYIISVPSHVLSCPPFFHTLCSLLPKSLPPLPPLVFYSSFEEWLKHPHFGFSSSWTSHSLWIISSREPNNHIRKRDWGWRDGSVVKGTDCSSRSPEFNSQQPHGGLQPSEIKSDTLFWCVWRQLQCIHIH